MSRLEKLIDELCPDGVEYIKLGDICSIQTGKLNANAMDEDGIYPFFTCDKEPYKINDYAFDTEAILISGNGSQVGHINYYNGKFNAYQRTYVLNNFQNYKIGFVLHFLKGKLRNYILINSRKGSIPYITLPMLQNFKIPLPPLPVQEEIVRILDTFAELTAELTMRKQQYEYYHNSLFEFKDCDIEYLPVGALFEFKNGLNKEKSAFGYGQPFINFTDVYKNRCLTSEKISGLVNVNLNEIESYSAKKGDVFFTRTSETKEDIGMSSALIEDIPNCVFNGFSIRARPITDLLLPKFSAYYFSTNKVRKTIIKYSAFTTRGSITGPKLSKILVPILSLEEQQRIVDILDRFDTLVNDIKTGLPAEIEARQKQYEYYRDKLLTFKKNEKIMER